MKITFVRPSYSGEATHDAMEPLAIAILAGLTPPEHDLRFYDERAGAKIPFDDPTDLVAITVETFSALRAYQIAARYRQRGVPVVMGGYHPTLLPDEAIQHADAVVFGDADGLWQQVLRDIERGALQPIYRQTERAAGFHLAPDRTIYAGYRYAPVSFIQYQRGCRFACDFCSIHAFYGFHQSRRPVAEVIAEIESLGRKRVLFVDDNLFADHDSAAELFRALIPLRLQWGCQVSIDITRHPDLLDLMAASGCSLVMIGLESLNLATLRQMKKGWNLKHGEYEQTLAEFRRRGIMIYAGFVFGYDGDTPETIESTLQFALDQKLCLANFNPLMPMPGTKLLTRLERENRLIRPQWWIDDRFRYGDVVFRPNGMSPEQLAESCFDARVRFNTWGAITRRAFDQANFRSPGNLFTYLLANVTSRREIHRKQGIRLGDGTPLVATAAS